MSKCTYCNDEVRVGSFVRRSGEVLCATCYDKATDGPSLEARRTQRSRKNLTDAWTKAMLNLEKKPDENRPVESKATPKVPKQAEPKMVMVDDGAPNLDDIEIPNFDE